ncbi:MurR/RpiR family transcriptional regulator [Phytoactinopolyspora alkaliphila]|uniref:MurR/RpiR family transcriptional regulator n=1 Tax=Phytoactinopolyspora alkaliphila TaxID=1783498 RepID=A0A6N9YFZ8_9ACTN|nr:MurR/RpiR family transcriptional regulator [Phytoactinopolyspora alkaliphila]NED93913.1 MurR/RpiR family transcriptional regulator [Phytoactinopolyspora alkaliphila]
MAASKGTLIRIRGLLPSLHPAERRVAEAVLADPGGVATTSITALARAGDTSEATVVRFCRTAGFSGYPELRLALAVEAGRNEASGERLVGTDVERSDTLEQIIGKIVTADERAIRDTAESLDRAALAEVVEAVGSARRIDLFGVGTSGLVIADLGLKLRRIGRMAFAWSDVREALSAAALMSEQDVAIGVSYTGATSDTVDALAEAKRQGATTVAITNFVRSPITREADHVLTTASSETTFRVGATASHHAQLTVVDILFVAVAQRSYDDTLRALEATFDAVGRRGYGDSRSS